MSGEDSCSSGGKRKAFTRRMSSRAPNSHLRGQKPIRLNASFCNAVLGGRVKSALQFFDLSFVFAADNHFVRAESVLDSVESNILFSDLRLRASRL